VRKKTILGNFIKNEGVLISYSIKKVHGEFEGYTALINFLPNSKKLIVESEDKKICLAEEGYKWLMYLPLNEKWCITTFYNSYNELFEWYFDISKINFVDDSGMPCTDDIFLDVVIMADGQSITIDEDELKEAYNKNEITVHDVNFAYDVRDSILKGKWSDISFLTYMSEKLLLEYKNESYN